MAEQSIVAAVREYFLKEPHGRKVEVAEFKALTDKDKADLRDMLIGEGYDVAPLASAKAA